MEIQVAPYQQQVLRWPTLGRVILAQYDDQTVLVYQAYAPSIGHFAAKNGYFGGDGFKFSRMTWIKPNFLWMMYRSGWGSKEGQQVVLAIRIQRESFDLILREAVHSSFNNEVYSNHDEWKSTIAKSDVRIQWDPDHDPTGEELPRRAIQLGLRGDAIKRFAREWIVDITDISAFVAEQRHFAAAEQMNELRTPVETVYPVSDKETATRLGIDRY